MIPNPFRRLTVREEIQQEQCEHSAMYWLFDTGQNVDLLYARRLGFWRYLVVSGRVVPGEDRP